MSPACQGLDTHETLMDPGSYFQEGFRERPAHAVPAPGEAGGRRPRTRRTRPLAAAEQPPRNLSEPVARVAAKPSGRDPQLPSRQISRSAPHPVCTEPWSVYRQARSTVTRSLSDAATPAVTTHASPVRLAPGPQAPVSDKIRTRVYRRRSLPGLDESEAMKVRTIGTTSAPLSRLPSMTVDHHRRHTGVL